MTLETHRLAVAFAIGGDLRFLSHQQMLRMFARALTRAEIPVSMSKGFNPRPKISLPLPRPVGVASEAERLVVEVPTNIKPDLLLQRLGAQMPNGIKLEQAWALEKGDRCNPNKVRYRVDHAIDKTGALTSRAEEILESDDVVIERRDHKTGRTKTVDLRPYIESIAVSDHDVEFSLFVTEGGSARPSEICDKLGLGGEHINHRVKRIEVTWNHKH